MELKAVLKIRKLYLTVGVTAMLFTGILYAWSILKIPFVQEFNWSPDLLAANFTLTMTFFCLGAFVGSLLTKKFGVKVSLFLSALLSGAGFILTGLLSADNQYMLFVTYALFAGGGIGISYNVVVSAVTSWFPDKKGFSSGCLMLGFGLSTLLLGNLVDYLYKTDSFGWKKTFIAIGAVLLIIIAISAFVLKRPDADTELPVIKPSGKGTYNEDFEKRDFSTVEMLKNFTFWMAFICMTFLTAVGNSAISFARDLVLSVEAPEQLATTMVGILAVCNGFGRILTGACFDRFGRKRTMLTANVITVTAAAVVLASVISGSLSLCIIGLCLTGISYGSCPTVTSAFTSAFYGQKHFAVNYSIMNFNLIIASVIAGISNKLLISTGGFIASFIMLLVLSAVAMIININIKKP